MTAESLRDYLHRFIEGDDELPEAKRARALYVLAVATGLALEAGVTGGQIADFWVKKDALR